MSNHQLSGNNTQKTLKLELTDDEVFLLNLIKKQDKQTINVKHTGKETKIQHNKLSKHYHNNQVIQLLESLVIKQKIEKKEKGLVLLCPKCGGYSSMPILVCLSCGSTKIGKRENLYHPACEDQSPREDYVDGVNLRCPHCNTLLDEEASEDSPSFYRVSIPYFECQDCGAPVSKNSHIFVCVKCGNKYTEKCAFFFNSVSYVLVSGEDLEPLDMSLELKLKAMRQPVLASISVTDNAGDKPEDITSQKLEKKAEVSEPFLNDQEYRVNLKKEKPYDNLIGRVSNLINTSDKKKPKKKKQETVQPLMEPTSRVLLIVEDVTVSGFIIEALEEISTPINVLHVDDGRLALKELRKTYSLVLIDLELKHIESKLILSEMERWGIHTPIIAFTDEPNQLDKYQLNICKIYQKKQQEYRKLSKNIKHLLI